MCLVEIFELACEIGPAHNLPLADVVQHSAKPPDTMEELRCKPNVFAKNLDKSRVAQANFLLHPMYGAGTTLS